MILLLFLIISSVTFSQTDGTIDSTFGNISQYGHFGITFGYDDDFNSISVLDDGKIIVTGTTQFGYYKNFAIMRLLANGRIDDSFGVGGKVYSNLVNYKNASAYASDIDDDGKILLSGRCSTKGVAVTRFNQDGTFDSEFGADGKIFYNVEDVFGARAVKSLINKKILVGGLSLVQLNNDGSIDYAFGVNGFAEQRVNETIQSIKIQADDKIVVCLGSIIPYAKDLNKSFEILRYNEDGLLDQSFGNSGLVEVDFLNTVADVSYDLSIQKDGKIVVAGISNFKLAMARLNVNGSMDNSFGSEGKVLLDYPFYNKVAVSMQSDNKILISGSSNKNINAVSFITTRFNTNGSIDSTFGKNGIANFPDINSNPAYSSNMMIKPNGKIMLVGKLSHTHDSRYSIGIIQINNNHPFAAPSTAILKTPINNTTSIVSPSNLVWIKGDYTDYYKLQISVDSNFVKVLVDSSGITDTSFNLTKLTNLTKYFWRVKSINKYFKSDWSETWNFKTIGKPTDVNPLLPLTNSENQPIELDFVWSKAKDQLKPVKRNNVLSISNYWFELNSDTNSSSVLLDSTLIDTTKHLNGLANFTKYYWRVRAKNETGWGGFSNWSKFTTIIDTPNVVNLITPLNNSNGLLASLVLTWNKSDFAESYSFQVSTDSTFTTTIIDSSGLADTSFVLNKLNILTKYYWRVKAKNIGGTSDWSEIWSFKTLGNPKDVIPLKPLSNSTNQPTEIDFIWNKAKEQLIAIKRNRTLTINNYWFELYADTASTSIIVDSTLSDTTKHVNNLENLTTYFWRVRAKNETGWGGFSNWSKFTTIIDAPSVVVLKSPLNNVNGLLVPIELKWGKSERVEKYNLQVSTNVSFSSTVIDSTGLLDTNIILTKLNNLTKYYWRVRSENIGGSSNWSETWNFKTLGYPTEATPLLPLASSVNQPIELSFVWSRAKDQLQAIKGNRVFSVGRYWFELKKGTSNVAFVVDSTLTDTTKHINNLENLTEYFWRVRAKNEIGWANFSNWSKFTTIVDTPNVVVLQSPLNNSDKNITPIEFIWNKSLLAENYTLQLSVSTDFTSNLKDSIGISDTSLIVNNLEDLTKYYWRVKAENIGGASNWSDTWSFKTLGKPTEVTPLFPLTSSVNQPIELNFVWSRAEDQRQAIRGNGVLSVSNYWFELNKDTSNVAFVVDSTLTDTTKHINNLENLTEYYWRVRAKNETGWGTFSEWSKFTTIVATPNVVVLQSPLNNSDKIIKPINLIWNKSLLAENYTLQLSVSTDFSSNLIDSIGISDTSLIANNLEDLTKYYWRVKAENIGGSSIWSTVWNFTTLGVPNAPTLISPENNREFADTTGNIKFVWSPLGLADSYTLEASANDSFDSLFVSVNDLTDTNYIYSNQLIPGAFYWRVKAKNQIGFSDYSEVYSFTITITDVDRLGNEVPQDYVLEQNYPNPFNPSTMVKYGLPEQSNVKIEVFNTLGQSVQVLVNSEKQSGFYETVWNADNLPSGIYLISIRAEGLSSKKNFVQVKKAMLLK